MVRVATLIWLVVLGVSACRPDERIESIAMQGILIAGEPLAVEVELVRDFQSLPLSNATVVCHLSDGGKVNLQQDPLNAARWFSNEITVNANTHYAIEVLTDVLHARAETTVPAAINLVQVSATVIPVNVNSLGQPIFTVLWATDAGISHVLTLTEPTAGETIPFAVPSGNFEAQYSLPVPGQGTTLFDTDFQVYGEHTLTVYAIDRAYENLFFYRPAEGGNRLTTGPSNVEGGTGYLTSATRVEVAIEIVE
jgi:hypothetical protein